MPKLEFLINLELCSDNRGCMTACKRQKDTPFGVQYLEVCTAMDDSFPDNKTYFIPIMCQHCDNPSCVPACPQSVFAKSPIGAVTVGDTAVCAECADKPCLAACPYGAIKLDKATGIVGKCDMCADLLAQGKPPACVPNCHCMAVGFGDVEDPASPYNQVMGMVDAMPLPREAVLHKLCPETGNEPSTTYILATKPWRNMDNLYSPSWKDE